MIPYEEKLSDLKIAGTGNATGGRYGKVRIDGSGQINGDIECVDLVANGNMSVNGSLMTQKLRVNGSGTVHGAVEAESLNVAGNLSLKDQLRSRFIEIGGHCSIHGDLESERLTLSGNLRGHGDVRSEWAELRGSFNISGRLHLGNGDIRLFGRCKALEVIGDRITVRRKGKRLWEMLSFSLSGPRLEARVIEGDVLDLEYVEADMVRGNRVILGKGCKVRQVEFRDELSRDPEAEIGTAHRF